MLLVDAKLSRWLDTLYRILGVDIQYMRDQLTAQFDQVLSRRLLEKVIAGLTKDKRREYESFINQSAGFTPPEGAEFLEKLCGRAYLEKTARQEAQIFGQEYLGKLLQGTTDSQRKQVQAALREVRQGYPQR